MPPPIGAEAPKSTAPQLILERLKQVTKKTQAQTFEETRQEITQHEVLQYHEKLDATTWQS